MINRKLSFICFVCICLTALFFSGCGGNDGSGTDIGAVGDTGSGTDTGVVGDTGSISTLNVTFSYPVPTDNIQGFRLYIGEDEICETETFPPLTMTCDISGLGITFPATFTMTAFDYDFNESPHSAPFTVNQTAVP